MKKRNWFINLKSGIGLAFSGILFLSYNAEAMLPLHLQNFDTAKTALRTVVGRNPDDGPLSIVTVTRSPIDPVGTTELISHNELEQLLRLLYSLCNGTDAPNYSEITGVNHITLLSRIPGVDRFRNWWWHNLKVPLNISLNAQLPVGHQHIGDVDSFCNDFQHFHERYLRNACNMIVFNEMFFSQVDPLTLEQKNFITDKLIELSSWAKNSFFYPNFLYTENRTVSGQEIYDFLDQMDINITNGRMDINYDPWCVRNCRTAISNNGILANGIMHNQEFLVNETYGINRGAIVTKYKKATYWNESNNSIDVGVLYDFGTGIDTQPAESTPVCRVLLDNVSTEICYDLANGVRQANNWNNGAQSSRIHILQSNSIDPFSEIPSNNNIDKLPLDVPLIYADSYIDYHRDGLPFCHDSGNERIRQGEFPYRLQEVRIGDSVYTIGIYLR